MEKKQLQILLIDDHQKIIESIKKVMEIHEGSYILQSCTSIEEAKSLMNHFVPDIVIASAQLKDGSGLEVLASDINNRHFPLVILDQKGNEQKAEGFLNRGALDYVTYSDASIQAMPNIIRRVLRLWRQIVKHREAEKKKILSEQELAQAHATLFQQEKMAAIGQLAAGIAHELNNPLGFVLSNFYTLNKYNTALQDFLSFLEESFQKTVKKESEQYADYLKKKKSAKIDIIIQDIEDIFSESQEGFDRMRSIVDNLRSFSRIDDGNKIGEYDLNQAILSTLTVAKNEIKYTANVETKFSEIPKIYCRGDEINQVLLNIIINAAQAIKSRDKEGMGKIEIETYADDHDVYCNISDDGPGIPEKYINKIFDPFFTTKEVGKGTGLGLKICHDIVIAKHKGDLKVKSQPGEGSTFFIKLPIESLFNQDTE